MQNRVRGTKQKNSVTHAGPKKSALPFDPDGLFERAAERGKVVVAMYEALNPGPAREDLINDLFHDLMHFTELTSDLENVHEAYKAAVFKYDYLLNESKAMRASKFDEA